MIYEFALEPELVARWCDRKEYLFFDEKFGLRSRRIVSAYPKKWKKLVWAAFSGGAFANDQNAQMRMTELVQYFWQNSIKRLSTFSEIIVWLERAEAEHAERPFHAILARDNPRKRSFVIAANDLIENGHELWKIPDFDSTSRNYAEIAKTISPLIQLCHHAVLVDPYFDPTKIQFRQTLEAMLNKYLENVCGLDNLDFELHTSVDRFFDNRDRGENRDPLEERRVYDNFILNCENQLPRIVPASVHVKVLMWKQKNHGERLHNRYFLTDMFGVMFGIGSDEARDPNSVESDDIVLLEEGQYLNRYKQYSLSSPAFDLVGEPFEIPGCKV